MNRSPFPSLNGQFGITVDVVVHQYAEVSSAALAAEGAV